MNAAKVLITSLAFATAVFATTVQAQGSESGRFDLAGLTGELSPTVNINFGPAMMKGFAESMNNANPDLATILGGVSGVRLMIFEDVDASGLEPGFRDAVGTLDRAGWTQAIQIQDETTLIDLFMIESADFVKGLVLLLRADGETLILANIHGDLDPGAVGRLVASGNIGNAWDLGDFINKKSSTDDDG